MKKRKNHSQSPKNYIIHKRNWLCQNVSVELIKSISISEFIDKKNNFS